MSKRDHYKGTPKTRKVVMDANGTIRPLDKANKIPERVSIGPPGDETLTFIDDNSQVNVYIDGVNGSDKNDGLTSTTALKTIQEFYRKFPWEYKEDSGFIVHLLNPTSSQLTYTIGSLHFGGNHAAFVNRLGFRGPEMIQIAPATGPAILVGGIDSGTPAETVNQQGVVDGSGLRTRINCTGAAPGWTTGDLRYYFLRITRPSANGAKVFFELPISDNTADTITVDTLGIVGSLVGGISGDTLEIVEPAVRINGLSNAFNVLTLTGRAAPANYAFDAINPFERIAFTGLWTQNFVALTLDRCFSDVIDANIKYSELTFRNCSWKAGLVFRFAQAFSASQSRPSSGSDPIDTGPVTGLLAKNIRLGTPGTAGGGFGVFSTLSVYGATAAGVEVFTDGSLIQNSGSVIYGSSNAGAGIRCRHGGYARISGGTNTTLSGAVGALQVDEDAAVEYGTGAGQFEEVAGLNGVMVQSEGIPSAITNKTVS